MNRLERGVLAAMDGVRNTQRLTLSDPTGWRMGLPKDAATSEMSAMKLSAVNRCQEVLSGSMGKLPIYCKDEESRQRVEHDILYLLNVRPNEAMTPTTRKQAIEGNRDSGGNGYDWIIRDPRSGRPVELVPLPWELVTPWRDERGLVWYGVVHPWTGAPMVLSSEDVCHYKAYSHDGLHGISVLHRAAEVISAGRAAQQYERNFYENGGYPSGVLSADGDLSGKVVRPRADGTKETVTHRDIIRAEWERVHAGPQNAHRVAVLDYGLKYQPITISLADAQFVESKAVTVEDIARFYGVPLSKLYAGKQAYDSNEQNAIDYVVSTLHPIVTQYDEEMTYKLLRDSEIRRGLRLKINMMAELKGDFTSRGTWYKDMREIGVFSPNDILDLEDMPAVDGGDERYASWNYGPLSKWAELSVKRAEKGDGKK